MPSAGAAAVRRIAFRDDNQAGTEVLSQSAI